MNLFPQLCRKKKLWFLAILFIPLLIFGNMASPYIEGSYQSSMYSIKDCRVVKEKISVKFLNADREHYNHYVHYHVIYQIISDVEREVPLVFVGKELYANQNVLVNNIAVQQLAIDENSKSFIKKNLNQFEIKFSERDSYEVQPNELIYFKAKFRKGENLIVVDYDAELAQNRSGFKKKFTLEYALYPSKFWKSFNNVEFLLEPSDKIKIESSNAGNFTKTDKAYVWKIKNFDADLIIEFSPEYNFFEKILLLLQPLGIALIFFPIFSIVHWKLLKKRRERFPTKYNWLVSLGILVVGILFYAILIISYDFIDWVLNQNSKHGYVLLVIILSVPFFYLVYGLLAWFADAEIKKRVNRLNEQN